MRSEAKIQQQVDEILSEHRIGGPPVDVIRLAHKLGIVVQPEFAEDELSGALYRQPNGAVIGVNALHHPNRQRFTIAHELGHYFLHTDDVFIDRAYSSHIQRPVPTRRRDRHSGDANDPYEIEANRFAACLLMPRSLLLNQVDAQNVPLRSENVEALAKEYAVSQQAMTLRLTNLGLPLDLT